MSPTPERPPAVRVALVSASAARDLDDDLPPLLDAFARLGAEAEVADWDDPDLDWGAYDLALVRSTWDYHARYEDFTAWVARTAARTALHNPPAVLAWNTDKRYLRDLAGAGLAVVPTTFLEPAAAAGDPTSTGGDGVHRALATGGEVVVKPAISAGARNTARYLLDDAAERARAADHARALLGAGRVVMVQPYLGSVDARGETAVVVIDGVVSHALRKGPLLERGAALDDALFAAEDMAAREASAAEVALAEAVVAHVAERFGAVPLYARVDLLEDAEGRPVLLELELTEPSLFFAFAPGAADHLARAALARPG